MDAECPPLERLEDRLRNESLPAVDDQQGGVGLREVCPVPLGVEFVRLRVVHGRS